MFFASEFDPSCHFSAKSAYVRTTGPVVFKTLDRYISREDCSFHRNIQDLISRTNFMTLAVITEFDFSLYFESSLTMHLQSSSLFTLPASL